MCESSWILWVNGIPMLIWPKWWENWSWSSWYLIQTPKAQMTHLLLVTFETSFQTMLYLPLLDLWLLFLCPMWGTPSITWPRWWFSSIQFSRSVVSDSLQPHESQHARPTCPSPTPRVYPNSCPSSQWCHPAISSSVVPFSSCPQSLPASGSFPMS